jgi:hypothetical protein
MILNFHVELWWDRIMRLHVLLEDHRGLLGWVLDDVGLSSGKTPRFKSLCLLERFLHVLESFTCSERIGFRLIGVHLRFVEEFLPLFEHSVVVAGVLLER